MANQRLEDSERKAIEGSADALERWEQADSEERRRELDRVGRQMLDVWGAPNPPLAPERWEDDRCLGQYCDEDYRIEVNQRLLERDDPREALEAYLHEYRHASQVV